MDPNSSWKVSTKRTKIFGQRFDSDWHCSWATKFSMIARQVDEGQTMNMHSPPNPEGWGTTDPNFLHSHNQYSNCWASSTIFIRVMTTGNCHPPTYLYPRVETGGLCRRYAVTFLVIMVIILSVQWFLEMNVAKCKIPKALWNVRVKASEFLWTLFRYFQESIIKACSLYRSWEKFSYQQTSERSATSPEAIHVRITVWVYNRLKRCSDSWNVCF